MSKWKSVALAAGILAGTPRDGSTGVSLDHNQPE